MSILSYKYKAHKFINYAFYVVVFIVGFLLGFASDKINYNKLINQVLMIDNVSAYTIESYNGLEFNEVFIKNAFETQFSDWENEYLDSYIVCNGNGYTWECHAYIINDDTTGLSISFITQLQFNNATNVKHYYWRYTLRNDTWYTKDYYITGNQSIISNGNGQKNATNFDFFPSNVENYANYDYSSYNKFDFSSYLTSKLKFNENLFKDNPDFKEVCVDSTKYFVISSDSYVNEQTIFSDFLWFPHGLYGLYQASYYTDSKEIFYQENESATYHYYFTNKEVINENFSQNNGLNYLLFNNSYYKYEDRYLYYGWTAYPFVVDYNESYISLPIYYFKNPITYDSLGDNIHGGGGTRLDGDEEIEISNEYCFYIKNNYHVEYLKVDEFNDFQGSIITPNGTIEIDSTNNKNNNTGNFLSQPKNFINSMKDTINFINSLIYEFYISLPLLLRTFIITLLIILIIMLIMKIGGYS